MKKTISLLSQQTNLYCVISSVFSSGIIHYLDKQCHKQHTQALEVLVFIMLTNLYFIDLLGKKIFIVHSKNCSKSSAYLNRTPNENCLC